MADCKKVTILPKHAATQKLNMRCVKRLTYKLSYAPYGKDIVWLKQNLWNILRVVILVLAVYKLVTFVAPIAERFVL